MHKLDIHCISGMKCYLGYSGSVGSPSCVQCENHCSVFLYVASSVAFWKVSPCLLFSKEIAEMDDRRLKNSTALFEDGNTSCL